MGDFFLNLDIEGQYSRNNGFEVEGQHSNNDGADSAERRMPRTILDPRRQFLQVYNKILLVSCVVAVSVDPLFFYIPILNDDLNDHERCLVFDKRLMTRVFVLRTVTDVIYLVHIILQFRTAFIDKASEEGGETKLNTNARAIIRRYLRLYFPIDILVVLPIPQEPIRKSLWGSFKNKAYGGSFRSLLEKAYGEASRTKLVGEASGTF
uniref:Uncharacterized protein n=1 Tax=Fagus sylvatica TaxID=28930 RepID=A0A2N9GE46_FAGSY